MGNTMAIGMLIMLTHSSSACRVVRSWLIASAVWGPTRGLLLTVSSPGAAPSHMIMFSSDKVQSSWSLLSKIDTHKCFWIHSEVTVARAIERDC